MGTSLPLDLARLVIEFTASADWSLQTVTALSLVSKEVQSWSDRYLFRDIVVGDDGLPRTEEFMRDFAQDNAPIRFQTARSYVRTFSTQATDGDERLALKFLLCCTNIHSIAFWHMTIPSPLRDRSIPSLERLSFSPGDDARLSFSAPLFRTITHLEIAGYDSSDWPVLWSAGLSSMPSLTHLVLDALPDVKPHIHLLSNLPDSVRIIMLRFGRITQATRVADDPRIVCFASQEQNASEGFPHLDIFVEGFHTWTGKKFEDETYWTIGERLLQKKLEGLIP
ncbi:hypothetical protein DL96DRAFT_1613387 [Flagelloscypha sp. PMI_526]|nr:hypothetical protein DL96DRAFT_1613387 [Flagelloscypha sp. PMI_526]